MNKRIFLTTCAAAFATWLLPLRASASTGTTPPTVEDGTLWVDTASGDVLRCEGGKWCPLGYLIKGEWSANGKWEFCSIRSPYMRIEGPSQKSVMALLREALAFYDRTREHPWWRRRLIL